MRQFPHSRPVWGFTLLELITVIVIIAILATLLIPVFGSAQRRAERVRCTQNLRNLHVAVSGYMQQNGRWPQISPALIRTRDYDKAWIAALEPFGAARAVWICPTMQKSLGSPDYSEKNPRIDYIATPFDAVEFTPRRWSTQPWFIERGDLHGNGGLMIFSGGDIKSLGEYKK